ncbi:MAG: phenylalanine--tRNA ligase subunit beta, partial [Candidatus Zixiibacteriota bacterium]
DVSFTVSCDGHRLGAIGRVKPDLARKVEIKQPVYLAEISLMPFLEGGRRPVSFTALPAFPAAPRDLAIIVDEAVRVGELLELVRKQAGALAEDVRVFDLYAGKPIPAGKKSVGISVIYRAAERSLTGEEVDALQAGIIEAVKKTFKAEVREK